jgi:transglutaminase-like putative cysteine protease
MNPATLDPRNAAGTFFQSALLGMLASGFLAVLGSGQLDLPTTLLVTAAICYRALTIAGWVKVLKLVPGTAVIGMLLFAVDLRWWSQSFVDATIHLTFYLAAVKLLTAETPRDFRFLEVIAGLEMLAAALLSADGNFFVFLTLFLLFMLASFAGGEIVRSTTSGAIISKVRPRALALRLTALSASLLVGILILTVALFFVLPRTARAAFQHWSPTRYHLPGFVNEVTMGDIGELKANSTPVMHVRSEENASLEALHWRGGALERFDGTRWYNPPAPEQRLLVDHGTLILEHSQPQESILRYSVEIGEIGSDTMMFAGTPQTIRVQAAALFRSRSQTLRLPRIIGTSTLRYAVYSRMDRDPQDRVAPLTEAERDGLLQLPQLDPRVTQLAKEWAGSRSPYDAARSIEAHFQRDFTYTLQMPEKVAPDPLAQFLFERKRGHCEYFASAMGVMLRALGIPSRVVTGFYGGVYNSISGWQVLRASDAHSWVEAWIPGQGWVTFDPTPGDPEATGPGLFEHAALWLDAAGQFWRDWVLSYDRDHQLVLAARVQNAQKNWNRQGWSMPAWLRSDANDWRDAVPWGTAALVLVAMVLYGRRILATLRQWLELRRARGGRNWQGNEAALLYERMLAILARHGFTRAASQTPQEFARTLPASELSALVQDLTVAYNQVRFGGEREPAARMVVMLERIETLPQSQ